MLRYCAATPCHDAIRYEILLRYEDTIRYRLHDGYDDEHTMPLRSADDITLMRDEPLLRHDAVTLRDVITLRHYAIRYATRH